MDYLFNPYNDVGSLKTSTFILIFQIRKLGHREVKLLAQLLPGSTDSLKLLNVYYVPGIVLSVSMNDESRFPKETGS